MHPETYKLHNIQRKYEWWIQITDWVLCTNTHAYLNGRKEVLRWFKYFVRPQPIDVVHTFLWRNQHGLFIRFIFHTGHIIRYTVYFGSSFNYCSRVTWEAINFMSHYDWHNNANSKKTETKRNKQQNKTNTNQKQNKTNKKHWVWEQ